MNLKIFSLCLILLLGSKQLMFAQANNFSAVKAKVDFSKTLRPWDGFGFNYVETAQTMNYEEDPQDYGGFSLLNQQQKQEVIDLIFGEDGLKVGLVKMFLDPFHQETPDGPFDHRKTTQNMREFVRMGLQKTRQRGADFQIITTMYGPPAWATKQKHLRGRDLNPEMKEEVANYMIDWAKFLKEEEEFPIKYISLHNEGESWLRWERIDEDGNIGHGHDYNLFWPPEQVVDFLRFMPPMMVEAGLDDVGLTPGETTNWYRFGTWGYSNAIEADQQALQNMALITSHGFYGGNYGRWFGEHKSEGIDILRAKKTGLHTWVTSTSWSNMDAKNIKEMHGNIYTAKVNGIIPWAGIQRPPLWVGGDPNPGSAFTVREDGTYDVRRGYYFYKQITTAGQPGMAVAQTSAMDSEIAIIGFASNGTDNPNAVIVVNISPYNREIALHIDGDDSKIFNAYRTIEQGNRYKNLSDERYANLGNFEVKDSVINYLAPGGSVTTFYAE